MTTSCGAFAGTDDGTITVAAASSLTDALEVLGTAYEADNRGVTVQFSFDGSSTLARQIVSGAPAQVFASADRATMDQVAAEDLLDSPAQVLARNRLVLVTKPGNPSRVRTLADLARLDVVALCGTAAPCGSLAAAALEVAQVDLNESHVTRGNNARATLGAVTNGDADAAIVYATDALSAGEQVDTIDLGDRPEITATLFIAPLAGGPPQADAFVAFALSERGQEILAEHGFEPIS